MRLLRILWIEHHNNYMHCNLTVLRHLLQLIFLWEKSVQQGRCLAGQRGNKCIKESDSVSLPVCLCLFFFLIVHLLLPSTYTLSFSQTFLLLFSHSNSYHQRMKPAEFGDILTFMWRHLQVDKFVFCWNVVTTLEWIAPSKFLFLPGTSDISGSRRNYKLFTRHLSPRTPCEQTACLFWEDFLALADQKPIIIEN